MDFAAFTYDPKTRVNVLVTPVKLIIDININPDYKEEKKEYKAIWDTGATNSVISEELALRLNLTPNGIATCSTANGMKEAKKYIVSLHLLNGVEVSDVHVTEGTLPGIDFLIGMDIITLGDFTISNVDNKTTFSFRIPSCKRIDYVKDSREMQLENLKKELKKQEKELMRNGNGLCSCGSRRKFRFCHGKEQIKQLKDQIEKLEKIKA